MKRCDCGEPATYTFLSNFMGYMCDKHAHEWQFEVAHNPEEWEPEDKYILLHSVEETDDERQLRWQRENVLWDE